MPAYYFHKPEAAINRAQQFLDVGKEDAALETLLDVLRSKKHRAEVQKLKKVIFEALNLCIKLQQSVTVKDCLYQFRNITSAVEPAAFNEAVFHFLEEAEARAAKAREESQQTALEEVEDLDQIMTPESLLLSTVSGEDTQSRTDRVVLTPWLRFLWEAFRNILDLVRNNKTFEVLYKDVAKRAFKFCLEYKRHSEFRKLCETFRNHLTAIQRQQPPSKDSYSVSLTNPESVICLVDIRFAQMHAAVSLDLWQEAYKAIDDVHNLFLLTSRHVKPKVWNQYYEKQAQVYWMANNRLFHAAALQRLYLLQKEQKKSITPEELQRLSSQVLLSTLAVPITPVPNEFGRFLRKSDIASEKEKKLASILRLQKPPTRNGLLQELNRSGILQYVPPELKQLYLRLEVEFNPLELCKTVIPILDALPVPSTTTDQEEEEQSDKPYSPPLGQYVEALKEVLLIRLIKQVSQVYHSISFERLQQLASFASVWELEKMVVEAAHKNHLQVRIDHLDQSLHFGTDLSLNLKEEVPEGPHVQSMPAETLRVQLSLLSQALQQAEQIISKEEATAKLERERQKLRRQCLKGADEDHKAMLARRKTIEERKEYLELQEKEKKRIIMEEALDRERRERGAEIARLAKEKKEREEEQRRREKEEIDMKVQMDQLERLKKTAVGAKAFADVTAEDLKDLKTEEIFSRQLKQMEKEKQEMVNNLKKQEKKIDYFERAKRLEEIPLLEKVIKEQRDADKQFFEEQEKERIATAIADHEVATQNKGRLNRMKQAQLEFLAELKAQRTGKWESEMGEFTAAMDKIRAERLEERRRERVAKRRADFLEELKEKREQEELARIAEEREQKEEEERLRLEKLEEQRKKQEEKDREMEEKMRQREQRSKVFVSGRESEEGAGRRPPSPKFWRQDESPSRERQRDEGAYFPPGRRGGGEEESEGGGWRDAPRRDHERSDRDRGWERRGDDRFDRRDDRFDWRRDDDQYERRRDGDRYERRRDDDRYERRRDDDRYERRRDDDRYERRDDRYERRRDDRYERRRDDDRYERRRDDDRYERRRDDDRYERRRDGDRYERRRDDDSDWRRGDDRPGDGRFERRWNEDRRDDDRYRRRDEDQRGSWHDRGRDDIGSPRRGDDNWRRDRGPPRDRFDSPRMGDESKRWEDRGMRDDGRRGRGDGDWSRRRDDRDVGRGDGDRWRGNRGDDRGEWRKDRESDRSPRHHDRYREDRGRHGDRQDDRDSGGRGRKQEKEVDEEGFELVRR